METMNYYVKGFTEAVVLGWKNMLNFSGRACRSEFWVNALLFFASIFVVNLLITIGVTMLSFAIPAIPVSETIWTLMAIYILFLMVVYCALFSRRLHDTDHSLYPGVVLVILTPIAIIAALLLTAVFSPSVIDTGVVFQVSDISQDWRLSAALIGSVVTCIAYIGLLIYTVPILFRQSAAIKE